MKGGEGRGSWKGLNSRYGGHWKLEKVFFNESVSTILQLVDALKIGFESYEIRGGKEDKRCRNMVGNDRCVATSLIFHPELRGCCKSEAIVILFCNFCLLRHGLLPSQKSQNIGASATSLIHT